MDRSGPAGRKTRAHPPHARLVGLSGREWPALAQTLAQCGVAASGTVHPPTPSTSLLGRYGVADSSQLGRRRPAHSACLLVHGESVERTHPERLRALRCGVDQTTPSGWVSRTLASRIGVGVAGGHEASAAAAMIGWVLTRSGHDPSVLLGRPAPQLGGWARVGDGAYAVAEWHGPPERLPAANPRVAVLMRVGGDPWTEPAGWGVGWRRCESQLESCGEVLALGHPSLAGPGTPGGLSADRFGWFSWQRGSDWWGTDLREAGPGQRFRVFHRGIFVAELSLQVLGTSNALAALAALAACTRLGLPVRDTRVALEEFGGLSRDFEPRGTFRGVTLIDDASEDPGPVRETLAVARRTFGSRRLWVVFSAAGEPGPIRLRRLIDALARADRVIITPAGPAAGRAASPPCGGGSIDLARRLAEAGVAACWEPDLGGVLSGLDRHLEPGDVLLTLGAGDVGTIADALIRRLPRDRQGG